MDDLPQLRQRYRLLRFTHLSYALAPFLLTCALSSASIILAFGVASCSHFQTLEQPFSASDPRSAAAPARCAEAGSTRCSNRASPAAGVQCSVVPELVRNMDRQTTRACDSRFSSSGSFNREGYQTITQRFIGKARFACFWVAQECTQSLLTNPTSSSCRRRRRTEPYRVTASWKLDLSAKQKRVG